MAGSSNSFTNKELLLKLIEINSESIKNMAETNGKMEKMEEKVEAHDRVLEKLSSLPDKMELLNESLNEIKDLQCEQNKQRDKQFKDFDNRIDNLEKKGGDIAKNVWKQIGTVVLGAVLTLIVGAIYSYLGGK